MKHTAVKTGFHLQNKKKNRNNLIHKGKSGIRDPGIFAAKAKRMDVIALCGFTLHHTLVQPELMEP